jgi:hypothetical protein
MIMMSTGPIQNSIPVEIAGGHLSGLVGQFDRRVGRPLEPAPAIAQHRTPSWQRDNSPFDLSQSSATACATGF